METSGFFFLFSILRRFDGIFNVIIVNPYIFDVSLEYRYANNDNMNKMHFVFQNQRGQRATTDVVIIPVEAMMSDPLLPHRWPREATPIIAEETLENNSKVKEDVAKEEIKHPNPNLCPLQDLDLPIHMLEEQVANPR